MISYRFITFVFLLVAPYLLNTAYASNNADYIDFSAVNSVAYGGQDKEGSIDIEDSGLRLRLTGNRVRAIPLNYTVTANTRIAFQFSSESEGEIHAIGLDNDLNISSSRTFQLYGTQTFGLQPYRINKSEVVGGRAFKQFDIPIGDFYVGDMRYLFLIMDHDIQNPDGQSVFSHIRIYEQPPQSLPPPGQLPTDVSGNADYINFSAVNSVAYGGQDRIGDVNVSANGKRLQLVGNRVRAIPFNYEVTKNTRISFGFVSSVEGEIHAIGLDNDLNISRSRTFQLYGTQTYGLQSHRINSDTTGSRIVKQFDIPIGEFYVGSMRYLFLIMDHDVSNPDGESIFRNIRVYEKNLQSLPEPDQPPIVSFILPAINTTLEAGRNIPIVIDANDSDGSIGYCALYFNGVLLGHDSHPPYAWRAIRYPVLKNVQPGTYKLKVECIDNDNLSGTAEQSVVVASSSEPNIADVMLDWVVPTTREDGATLLISEIESYVIYYYRDDSSSSGYNLTVPLRGDNGELTTSYLISALPSGRYYFSIASVDTSGRVSQFSDPVELTIQ